MDAGCEQCGEHVGDGDEFCSACGALQSGAADGDENSPQCGSCGAALNAADAFCAWCGSASRSELLAVGDAKQPTCSGCGHELDSVDAFCSRCGTRSHASLPAVSAGGDRHVPPRELPNSVVSQPPSDVVSVRKGPSGRNRLLIAAAAILVALAAVGAAAAFALRDDGTPSKSSAAPTTSPAAPSTGPTQATAVVQAVDVPAPAATTTPELPLSTGDSSSGELGIEPAITETPADASVEPEPVAPADSKPTATVTPAQADFGPVLTRLESAAVQVGARLGTAASRADLRRVRVTARRELTRVQAARKRLADVDAVSTRDKRALRSVNKAANQHARFLLILARAAGQSPAAALKTLRGAATAATAATRQYRAFYATRGDVPNTIVGAGLFDLGGVRTVLIEERAKAERETAEREAEERAERDRQQRPTGLRFNGNFTSVDRLQICHLDAISVTCGSQVSSQIAQVIAGVGASYLGGDAVEDNRGARTRDGANLDQLDWFDPLRLVVSRHHLHRSRHKPELRHRRHASPDLPRRGAGRGLLGRPTPKAVFNRAWG